jgi:fructuronate reductase
LGAGAFHRAHQAVYTDDALAAAGGDWRIFGVSLRSTALRYAGGTGRALHRRRPQRGGDRARVVGSLAGVVAATREREAVLGAGAPSVRVVTMTVTEKAYGIDRAAGDVDVAQPFIAADLAAPRRLPRAVGVLVEGLRRPLCRGAAAVHRAVL